MRGGRARARPQRLAAWLGGALGGPTAGAGDGLRAVLGLDGGDFGEDERARWVALVGTAADEARLPADAGFRRAVVMPGVAVAHGAGRWRPRRRAAVGLGPGRAARPAGQDARHRRSWRRRAARSGGAGGIRAHIKPLFRARDRQSMSFVFDLWYHDDVRVHAADIARRLQDGIMPCDGAWSAARIEVFHRWAGTGLRP